MQDGHEIRVDSDEGSSEEDKSVSYICEHSHRGDHERELENLQKLVNDLEIKLRS